MSRYNTYTLPLGPADITVDAGDPEVRKVISSTVAGITSSNTANTLLYSTRIPGGTYIINEVLDIRTLATKTNTNATCTLRFYYGETASLTATGPYAAATQLAQCLYTATSLSLPLHRRLGIRNATASTIVFDATRSATTDLFFQGAESTGRNGDSPGGVDLIAIDWTEDVWILVSGDTDSASDILQVRYFKINN